MSWKSPYLKKWFGLATLVVVMVPLYQNCGEFRAADDLDFFGSVGGLDASVNKTCGANTHPGHAMIHRLSNEEYNNTVRDLLMTSTRPGDNFQSTSIGSSGFSNDSSVLTLSPQVVKDYLAAGETLAKEVIASKSQAQGAYAKIAPCAVGRTPDTACAKSTVRNLALRAFRRPLSEGSANAELETLMKIHTAGGSFDQGLSDVIVALLIDPRFLFIHFDHSQPQNPNAIELLDGYELASRISYFIWQSMPDDQLLQAAANQQLSSPEQIRMQVERMLKDQKSKAFANVLRKEWAHLTPLDNTASLTGVDAATLTAIRQETQYFLEDIVMNDRSLLSVIDSNFTYVNSTLANYYGWAAPAGSGFQRVTIPNGERRGILTQASMLITHGGGSTYSHPVQRGRFVADSIYCDAPPPPPVGIPTIGGDIGNGTMKERLQIHSKSAACAGCHQIMDPIGLGLENFDPLGKWRTSYSNGAMIDPSGRMPAGFAFQGPEDMMDKMAEDPKVRACLGKKVMAYALARELKSADETCVAGSLGTVYASRESTLSDLISGIVLSVQFRAQAGEAAQ